jgi:hypothetical protein
LWLLTSLSEFFAARRNRWNVLGDKKQKRGRQLPTKRFRQIFQPDCQNLLFLAPIKIFQQSRFPELSPECLLRSPLDRNRTGAQEEPQPTTGLWLFLLNAGNQRIDEKLNMNPEIRAILFGLLIAALACPVILALFYSP